MGFGDSMPQNSQFVKQSPATALRDSNDALAPLYWGGKLFMWLVSCFKPL
jgi:hypothetical protein